jgi:two-component system sensor histidine kinase TctE
VAWFVPEAISKEIDITVDFAEAIPRSLGIGTCSNRCSPIFDNAIRYNRKGGYVHVAGKMEDSHFILTIEDDGPGIPDEQRQQAIERFYRTSFSRSGGAGLVLRLLVRSFCFTPDV